MTKAKDPRAWQAALALAMLAGLVAMVGWNLRDLATDDPFVTYRYARNLAQGRGLVYNTGERVLSTTAPFYAILLAVGARLGADIPLLSNTLGAVAFWGAAGSLLLLTQRRGFPWAGIVAGTLCASAPLLWLTLGFETGLYIALVCWAFWAFDARRPILCAILLALATIIRNDGLVATVVLGVAWWVVGQPGRGISPWRLLLPYVIIVGAWAVWLVAQFGSPIPVTLAAKSIQARFGLTGFYPDTGFLEGLVILWCAWSAQTWLHWLAVPLIVVGAAALPRVRWAWWLVGWSVVMGAAYVVMGVAPYPWYYAPLAPGAALLIGLGTDHVRRRVARVGGWVSGPVVAVPILLLVWAHLASLVQAAQAIHGPVPPPEEIAAKVLPEAKTAVYRRVGEWLQVNTPPDATVGVTEVGVIGYYADRHMVDFLGLLKPDVARALARGDILWAVPAYAPDYLALTAVNPLYSYPILRDEWFQQAYRPVAWLEDARFWGSPVTIYQRAGDAPPPEPHDVGRAVMDGVTLVGWAADGPALVPAAPLRMRLTWRVSSSAALSGAQVSAYLVDVSWHEVAKRVLRYDTSAWAAGGDIEVYHLAVAADDVPAGRYGLHLRVEDAEGVERFEDEVGWLKVPPAGTVPPQAVPLDVSAGFCQLDGYMLAPASLQAGRALTVTLYWAAQGPADRDWTVFAHLLDGTGQLVVQADDQPLGGRYPTTVWGVGEIIPDRHTLYLPDRLPDGPYRLLVGLYDLQTGERLPMRDGAGHPLPEQMVQLQVP